MAQTPPDADPSAGCAPEALWGACTNPAGACQQAARRPPSTAPPQMLDAQPRVGGDSDLRGAGSCLSPTLPQRPAPRPNNGCMAEEQEPEPEQEPTAHTHEPKTHTQAQAQVQTLGQDGSPEADPEVATPLQPFSGEEGVAFVERDPTELPRQSISTGVMTALHTPRRRGGVRVPARPPPARNAQVKGDTPPGQPQHGHAATTTQVAEAAPVLTPRRRPPTQASLQHGHSEHQRAETQRLATAADHAVQHAAVERLERHRRACSKLPPPSPPRISSTSRCGTSVLDSSGPPSSPAREGQPPAVPPTPVGIGRPARFPSLFLVDWDDTILPTSLLARMIPLNDLARAGSRDATRAVATTAVRGRLSSEFTDQLCRLESAVLRALERIVRAVGLDSLVLVTNAAQGWVDATASLLMPKLYSRMLRPESGKGVRVVYARPASVNRASQCTKGAQTAWKLAAFALEVSAARAASIAAGTGPRLNLVSIGDSDYERTAMKRAATRRAVEGRVKASDSGLATEPDSSARDNSRAHPGSADSPGPLERFWFESDSGDVVKTVKFRESPGAVQLRKQWQCIWAMLPELCEGTSSNDTVLQP